MALDMVKLGDVLEYEQPTKYLVKSERYHPNYEIPVLTAGKSFILGYTNENTGIFCDTPVIIFDDFTTSIKYVDFPFKVKSTAMKILKPTKNIDLKYVFFKMSMIKINTQLHKRYWISNYSQIKIPLPPLEEQKRIATILDKAHSIRQKRKQNLNNADALIKSIFLDMFGDPVTNPMGWEPKEFDFFANIDTKMTTDFEKYSEQPHIGIDSIEKETGNLVGYRTVKEDNLVSGKYIFTPKHIIYSKIRPNLNKVALPNFYGLCSADAYPILPKDNCERLYLAYIMRSNIFLEHILPLSGRTNIPKANKEQIRKFVMPLPPIDLQNKFAEIVTKIEAQKTKQNQHLHEADQCFKALQQQFFG